MRSLTLQQVAGNALTPGFKEKIIVLTRITRLFIVLSGRVIKADDEFWKALGNGMGKPI